jgi:stearoyl-CoA desaturase (delta-9 desaturase)
MFIWGSLVSFLLASHVTLTVNSAFHYGKFSDASRDHSQNVTWIWPIMLGENLHHNHHLQPALATNKRKGDDIDLIYYLLLLFEKFGLIYDVRKNKEEEIGA